MDLSLIIAIASLFFALYVYLRSDKKIKEQQKLINNYELESRKRHVDEKKKAKVRGAIIKEVPARGSLVITNNGKSTAYDIDIALMNELRGIFGFNLKPHEKLNESEFYKMDFLLAEGHSDSIKIKITWRDSFSKTNEYTQILQIT